MFLLWAVFSIASRRHCLILIATVLSMTPVVCYVHAFHPSYHPCVGQPIVTSLASANILNKVAAVGATIVIGLVQRTIEETSLVFTTDAVNTDIYKTNITEQTALAHVRILVLQIKNQPPQPTNQQLIQSHHQVSVRSGAIVHFSRSVPAYYRSTAKNYLLKRKQRRHRPVIPGNLDDWEQVEDWIPTEITNDIVLPSHDEYYDINYPFYRSAFVLGHAISPNTDILPGNELHHSKVRSAVSKRKTKPPRLLNNALILDSGANIHIINNPSFLSCIRSCIGQFINTTGSRKECKHQGQLCDALKPLPLPHNGYLYQPNNIGNIINLSLLWIQRWRMLSTYTTSTLVHI